MEAKVERLSTIPATDFQNVAKALRGNERSFCALPLQQGVNDERCTVFNKGRITYVQRGLMDAIENRIAKPVIVVGLLV